MTEQELLSVIGSYAAEKGVMPHRIAALVDLFRLKMTDEQLVARAIAKALERGCPSEHLTNPRVTEAVHVRFGGDAPISYADVWLDKHGDGCAMAFSPKQHPRDDPAT